MFCSNCGKKVNKTSKFCNNCGQEINVQSAKKIKTSSKASSRKFKPAANSVSKLTPSQAQKDKKRLWSSLVLFIASMFAVVAFLIMSEVLRSVSVLPMNISIFVGIITVLLLLLAGLSYFSIPYYWGKIREETDNPDYMIFAVLHAILLGGLLSTFIAYTLGKKVASGEGKIWITIITIIIFIITAWIFSLAALIATRQNASIYYAISISIFVIFIIAQTLLAKKYLSPILLKNQE